MKVARLQVLVNCICSHLTQYRLECSCLLLKNVFLFLPRYLFVSVSFFIRLLFFFFWSRLQLAFGILKSVLEWFYFSSIVACSLVELTLLIISSIFCKEVMAVSSACLSSKLAIGIPLYPILKLFQYND